MPLLDPIIEEDIRPMSRITEAQQIPDNTEPLPDFERIHPPLDTPSLEDDAQTEMGRVPTPPLTETLGWDVHHWGTAESFTEEETPEMHGMQKTQSGALRLHPPRLLKIRKDEGSFVKLTDFDVISVLGKGTFSIIYLVRLKHDTTRAYALKTMSKARAIQWRQVQHLNSERDLLSRISYPFLPYLHATFQDELNVYLVQKFFPYGEMFGHLRRERRFHPTVARFFICSILLALKYLHDREVVYRDLKPENVVLDNRGYACLVDFGFSKYLGPENRTYTLCGTPEYLAPEIIQGIPYGRGVDLWACGIFFYEMIYGHTPFYDAFTMNMYDRILRDPVEFPAEPAIDLRYKHFIFHLLRKEPTARLGCNRHNYKDVMAHPLFTGVNWSAVEQQKWPAPMLLDDRDYSTMKAFAPADTLPGIFPEFAYEREGFVQLLDTEQPHWTDWDLEVTDSSQTASPMSSP